MIAYENATKRYGAKTALDALTVQVRSGHVTGLLGPNGAGKSTAMRLLLGLDRPTQGGVTIDGVPYARLKQPLRAVGAHLDARSCHPRRSARAHLLGLARHAGLPAGRVDEVIEVVGLESVARRRAGGFSLGMGQRLGIAAALLGDPAVLVLDEPMNGLDTDGVRWIRSLLQSFAAEGRTVLVSSHLMAEMHQTVDRVIVMGKGRLLADCTTRELVASVADVTVLRTPDLAGLDGLVEALEREGMSAEREAPGTLSITGGSIERIGDLAFERGVRVHSLSSTPATLEEGYLRLVEDEFEFRRAATPAGETVAIGGAGR
ncbi:ATP-binding cassette domain-containing protein [Glycomyces paridis]|uniref:ATP-binding cassette domain-containing protein n=1 Tax=Glycomyces paridis TaxID=2126555 RepID=A0A4S8PJ99_9ACTN|nr:ATP-binding cassette domain-containing protein [Glycomyces paridis]THV28374.1 ATP-binding cassette domain-containing protein [Glycomyces paridis]